MPAMSLMRDEALSCGACAAAFLVQGLEPALAAGRALRQRSTLHVDVLGRGSSSHAGTVLRYAWAVQGGLSVSAVMPWTAANDAPLSPMPHTSLVAISQSGRSPDLVRYALAARQAGAYVVGLINTGGSPLGAAADQEVPLCAGPELAVAATKSVVMSVVAGLGMVAGFSADAALLDGLRALPGRLDEAARCDWADLSALLPGARAVFVVGRGVDLGIAKEMALKIAETVGIPALAFSSAEFLHGPLGAVSAQTPVVGVVSDPRALESVLTALERARGQGAPTLLAHGFPSAAGTASPRLPLPAADGTPADCVLALLPAYLAIEAAAQAAGRNPDQPRGLSKVTETL